MAKNVSFLAGKEVIRNIDTYTYSCSSYLCDWRYQSIGAFMEQLLRFIKEWLNFEFFTYV